MTEFYRPFKTEIKPNKKQKISLNKSVGVSRFSYNWALAGCEQSYKNGDKIFEPNAKKLHKLLNSIKKEKFPWMYEVSKCAAQNALRNLDIAYKKFFNKQTERPKFKKKNDSESCYFDGAVYVKNNRIHIPKVGLIKVKEKDFIPDGDYKNVTVSRKANKWFISVANMRQVEPVALTDEIIGIDLGIRCLAVLSSGETFGSPQKLKQKEQKLKRYQRKFARQKNKSCNKKKTKLHIQKIHLDIVNERKDNLHKITSFVVKAKRPSVVVIEDLNVSGMKKNHNLAKAISNGGFYEFRRQLQYKCQEYGVEFIVADRWFPSSKMCSGCASYKSDLKLSDRTYSCDCGSSIDRDLNAAYNLRNYGKRVINTASSAGIDACDRSERVGIS